MELTKFSGTMESAYGQKLEKPLAFEGSYEAFTSYDEIPEKELPSQDDILNFVNNQLKANARQKAMNKVLDDNKIVKPTLKDSPELQISTMAKVLLASGKYTQEQAEAIAKQTLGY
jgi:hypothetical protein